MSKDALTLGDQNTIRAQQNCDNDNQRIGRIFWKKWPADHNDAYWQTQFPRLEKLGEPQSGHAQHRPGHLFGQHRQQRVLCMFMIVDIAVTAMLLENSVTAWSLGELCWKILATPLPGEHQSLFTGGKTILASVRQPCPHCGSDLEICRFLK